MTCKDCQAATQAQGNWTQYNALQCQWCAARLIQQIGRLKGKPAAEIIARRRAVLADAVAWGHTDQEIRDLAASKEMAVQPVEAKGK